MSKTKYIDVEPNEWQYPVMTNYQMRCCDCGLVHSMDFEVIAVKRCKGSKDKIMAYSMPRTSKGYELRIRLRARRNNKATAAGRRRHEVMEVGY
jgi:hypothetical protein